MFNVDAFIPKAELGSLANEAMQKAQRNVNAGIKSKAQLDSVSEIGVRQLRTRLGKPSNLEELEIGLKTLTAEATKAVGFLYFINRKAHDEALANMEQATRQLYIKRYLR